MTGERRAATIPTVDDNELTDLLESYAETCDDAVVDPLPVNELAVLADAMLAAGIAGAVTRH